LDDEDILGSISIPQGSAAPASPRRRVPCERAGSADRPEAASPGALGAAPRVDDDSLGGLGTDEISWNCPGIDHQSKGFIPPGPDPCLAGSDLGGSGLAGSGLAGAGAAAIGWI